MQLVYFYSYNRIKTTPPCRGCTISLVLGKSVIRPRGVLLDHGVPYFDCNCITNFSSVVQTFFALFFLGWHFFRCTVAIKIRTPLKMNQNTCLLRLTIWLASNWAFFLMLHFFFLSLVMSTQPRWDFNKGVNNCFNLTWEKKQLADT